MKKMVICIAALSVFLPCSVFAVSITRVSNSGYWTVTVPVQRKITTGWLWWTKSNTYTLTLTCYGWVKNFDNSSSFSSATKNCTWPDGAPETVTFKPIEGDYHPMVIISPSALKNKDGGRNWYDEVYSTLAADVYFKSLGKTVSLYNCKPGAPVYSEARFLTSNKSGSWNCQFTNGLGGSFFWPPK
jgi:hypothetical protein